MSERDEAPAQDASGASGASGASRCPACGVQRPDTSIPCPRCGAPAAGAPRSPREQTAAERRASFDAMIGVRDRDLEPYTGLRYLSKLFRMIAIILILLLVAEVVTGLSAQGQEAIPTLISEASRLIVLAALLWGVGDLALLLIDVGHDVRAARILLGRQAAHHAIAHHDGPAAANAARMGLDAPAVVRVDASGQPTGAAPPAARREQRADPNR